MASSEYMAWVNMRQRCNNINHPEYSRYGGRGIEVDPNWNNFDQFIADMGLKVDNSLSIERQNNSLGYTKSNCIWAKKSRQSFNQRISCDNTTGITGVNKEKQTGNWKAYIRVENKQITLGRFPSFFNACCARKSAELKYYPEVTLWLMY